MFPETIVLGSQLHTMVLEVFEKSFLIVTVSKASKPSISI